MIRKIKYVLLVPSDFVKYTSEQMKHPLIYEHHIWRHVDSIDFLKKIKYLISTTYLYKKLHYSFRSSVVYNKQFNFLRIHSIVDRPLVGTCNLIYYFVPFVSGACDVSSVKVIVVRHLPFIALSKLNSVSKQSRGFSEFEPIIWTIFEQLNSPLRQKVRGMKLTAEIRSVEASTAYKP